jgi:hypothetical protein
MGIFSARPTHLGFRMLRGDRDRDRDRERGVEMDLNCTQGPQISPRRVNYLCTWNLGTLAETCQISSDELYLHRPEDPLGKSS